MLGVLIMLTNFYNDLRDAKKGEAIVLNVLKHTTEEYIFSDVSEDKKYYYKGDIKALDACWELDEFYLDVKMDGRIAETGNILCEHKVYYKDKGAYGKGNMQSDYDYLAIISVDTKKIFIIDFAKLKKHYKEGRSYYKDHGEQITYGTLFPMSKAWKYNMVEAVIDYEKRNGGYFPVKIER